MTGVYTDLTPFSANGGVYDFMGSRVPAAMTREQFQAMVENAPEEELRQRLTAPAENLSQALFVSEDLPQTARVMVKDEDLCVHCGLCAERCPTAAWDMRKSELLIPHAGHESWPTTTAVS